MSVVSSRRYFGRERREEVERRVVVVEQIETRQLPLVIWVRRRCPFCESVELSVYGTKDGGELRYYRCESCRQQFRVKEL